MTNQDELDAIRQARGTCPKCAEEMALELLSVLAVLNCCQYGKDPYQLELKEGGVSELVAKAIWGDR